MSKQMRGFASMSIEQRKAIASMGGKEAHRKGNAHQFTSEEAAIAGKKGGRARKGIAAPSKRKEEDNA